MNAACFEDQVLAASGADVTAASCLSLCQEAVIAAGEDRVCSLRNDLCFISDPSSSDPNLTLDDCDVSCDYAEILCS